MLHILVAATVLSGVDLDLRVDRESRTLHLVQSGQTLSAVNPKGLIFDQHATYSGFDTCAWMRCDPSPDIRAPLRLSIVAPAGEWVVASGTLERVEPLDDGERRFVWDQPTPYPAYLYGFIVGPLRAASTDIDGALVEVVSPVATTAELQRYLHAHSGMIRFFEKAAGFPLPRGRYTAVVVAGSAEQEKSSFSLLGTDELAALADDPSEDWLIAHELAHQWWGNLVTPRSWREMWLSEGIVTFMTAAWKESRWGREKYDREMDLARRRVEAAVKEGFDVPLSWNGEFPSLRTRRAIAYSRGALFMDHLRRDLGEDLFWKALRTFTFRHRGQSVTSSDFQRAFEQVSGRDLTPVFRQWVYGDSAETQRSDGSE